MVVFTDLILTFKNLGGWQQNNLALPTSLSIKMPTAYSLKCPKIYIFCRLPIIKMPQYIYFLPTELGSSFLRYFQATFADVNT